MNEPKSTYDQNALYKKAFGYTLDELVNLLPAVRRGDIDDEVVEFCIAGFNPRKFDKDLPLSNRMYVTSEDGDQVYTLHNAARVSFEASDLHKIEPGKVLGFRANTRFVSAGYMYEILIPISYVSPANRGWVKKIIHNALPEGMYKCLASESELDVFLKKEAEKIRKREEEREREEAAARIRYAEKKRRDQSRKEAKVAQKRRALMGSAMAKARTALNIPNPAELPKYEAPLPRIDVPNYHPRCSQLQTNADSDYKYHCLIDINKIDDIDEMFGNPGPSERYYRLKRSSS